MIEAVVSSLGLMTVYLLMVFAYFCYMLFYDGGKWDMFHHIQATLLYFILLIAVYHGSSFVHDIVLGDKVFATVLFTLFLGIGLWMFIMFVITNHSEYGIKNIFSTYPKSKQVYYFLATGTMIGYPACTSLVPYEYFENLGSLLVPILVCAAVTISMILISMDIYEYGKADGYLKEDRLKKAKVMGILLVSFSCVLYTLITMYPTFVLLLNFIEQTVMKFVMKKNLTDIEHIEKDEFLLK